MKAPSIMITVNSIKVMGINCPQLMLLQVELPFSQTTVVRVAPSILMGELLCYICGKRNMNPAHHRFDLPVTEESLAQRSLQQLRISAIKVIRKGQSSMVLRSGFHIEVMVQGLKIMFEVKGHVLGSNRSLSVYVQILHHLKMLRPSKQTRPSLLTRPLLL